MAVFILLSVTAGICEEFIYRGYVCGALFHVHTPVWGGIARFVGSVWPRSCVPGPGGMVEHCYSEPYSD